MSITLHGTSASNGIAIGRAHLVSKTEVDIIHYTLDAAQIPSEIARYEQAVRHARKNLEHIRNSIPDNAPAELGTFLSLHIMMLSDHSLAQEPRDIIKQQSCNAEWALKLQRDELLAQFDEIEESYLRERRADVIQVVNRIFAALAGEANTPIPLEAKQAFILVAHDLGPADMVLFKNAQFSAFVTDIGGSTSHTAILARSLGLPSILALHSASKLIHNDDLLIVDGNAGVLIVDPDPVILAEYQAKQQAWYQHTEALAALTHTPAITQDGTAVDLLGNIELPADIPSVKNKGGQGIGLFRSEFLFLGRNTLPTEEEQFTAYRSVVESMQGAPVTIRTLDLGADKIPKWRDEDAENLIQTSTHSALGLCGIRLCLSEPQLFKPQLRALLRASHNGSLAILLPMLSTLQEVFQAKQYIAQAKAELKKEHIPFDESILIGGMIETPAAALISQHLAKELDFLSIGTNDLVQYTLAIDRTDDAVANLYDPTHPAVLQLIALTIQNADAAGIPISICGEMAGDTQLTRLLLGLGLRKFSMHPANLLAVKRMILSSDISQCEGFTHKMLNCPNRVEQQALLAQLNQ